MDELLKKILNGENVSRWVVLRNEKKLLNLCNSCEERAEVLTLVDLALESL